MRHENGNCLPVGGFCTAVNDASCEALQQAFEKGYRAGYLECKKDDLLDTTLFGTDRWPED
jgi:hypothetical protein